MEHLFGYPEYSLLGERVITNTAGDYKDMMMNISAFRMKAGECKKIYSEEEETAILLIQGGVTFQWPGQTRKVVRKDCFSDGGYCLHVCRKTEIAITADTDSEILVQSTGNDQPFPTIFYEPDDCRDEIAGKGLCENTAVRTVRTMFDYRNAPYSHMVLGEVIARQGGWSGYIPHSHRQPEVYYYHFDHPQGFGACFIGDNAFKVKDGSFCAIPGGLTHPQVTAPGYRMYYVWMIRHLDGDPWTDRELDSEHVWLLQNNK